MFTAATFRSICMGLVAAFLYDRFVSDMIDRVLPGR
jgi:hypothetical protein